MAWQTAFSSLANYRRLLIALQSVVVPIEVRIAELLDALPPGYRPTDRSLWLRDDVKVLDDLVHLAGSAEPIEAGHIQPDVGYLFDQSGAIGALYVLEGSTLGGQILLRQLQSSLPLGPTRGGRYFASRGLQTAGYWRAFVVWANQRLEQLAGTDAAVQAARETFQCFEKYVIGNCK